MATLIQSKQIQGVVTASVVEGSFTVSGSVVTSDITASSISSSGPIYGVRYSDVQGTPSFIGGSGILITQVGTQITITNTGGGGGVSGSAELISSVAQLNSYTGSNDIIILGLEQFTASIQSEVDSLETRVSALESQTDNTGSDTQTLSIVGDQLTISGGNTITIPTGSGGGGTSDFTELTNVPIGLVSSSEQILGGTGILSGSHIDISSLNTYTSSIDSRLSSLESATASLQSQIDGIVHTQIPEGTISSSQQILDLGFVTSSGASGEHTDISVLNAYTASNDETIIELHTRIDTLSAATSSYLTSETDSQTLSIVGDQLTISSGNTITIPTGSSQNIETSSLATTGSNVFIGDTQVFRGEGTTALQIGDTYQGGIVFYVSNNLSLIADTSDLSSGITLGNIGVNDLIGGETIGDGVDNTNNIAINYPFDTTPSRLVYNSTNGGYSDWYLPNGLELNTFILNVGGITGNYATSEIDTGINGGTPFNYFVIISGESATKQTFGGGVENRFQTVKVRAIRKINTGVRPSDDSDTNIQITGSLSATSLTGSLDYSNLTNVPAGILSGSIVEDLSSSLDSRISVLENQNDNTGSDSQALSIVGDQLTISSGNTITIPTGSGSESTDITALNTFTGSIQSQVDSLTSATSSYLTELPSGLVSGSVLRTLDGTSVISSSQQIADLGFITSSENVTLPSGLISSSQQLIDLGFSTTDSTGSDNQTISISGDQLTISGGNTITIPTGSNVILPSGLISSSEQILGGSDIVSGSVLRTLGGTGVLSGSVLTDLSASITTTIENIQHTSIPSGVISGSTFTDFSSSVHTEIQSIQHTDITQLNEFTSSIQTEVDGLSSQTASYLTELPSGLISSSEQVLGGTGILSGSQTDITQLNQFTSSYLTDSASFDTRIDNIVGGDSSFNGDRVVTNTLLGDLFTESFNAGTSGSLSQFIEQVFFPSYAPTATFSTQTSNLNTNLTADGTVIETISVSDTVDDSPYVVTISGDSSDAFRVVPTNANSSSWEIQSIANLLAGTFTYDIIVTDKNGASRTYSSRSIEILQAGSGTLSTTGTLYIIESAQSGPIYLGSSGRSGAQGGVSVSYSPNYGSQAATSFTSSNFLIGINSSTGVLSVGSPISGSGNLSGSTITTTIGWTDQYGNTSSEVISVNVTQNNAPDIIFTNSTRLNTNQAVNGGGTLVTITFSDTEGDSINHASFQFTDVSGQLTATKSGNNYLVTADNNLSGSTTYTIGATVEDTHGFRSNTESHSFTIVQGGIGSMTGDSTMYIIESAVTNASFRDATGFGNGNTAQVGVTYSPSAGSQVVQSFSSSNPSILINSSGNMTLGVDLSGSVTQSGDTIQTLITFQDQYGNIGSGSVTANVFGNNAPSVTFVATSDYDTDGSIANSNAGVITITDTETNSPYNVTLGGTNGSLFNAVPQNVASSSWQVQPKDSLTADTYSIDISVTDNYGESSTLSNKSIVVDAVASGETVYVYTNSIGAPGAWGDGTYNGVMGISTVNSSTPPEVLTYTSTVSTLGTIVNNDVLGDSTISTNGGNGTLTLVATLTNVTDLDTALSAAGSISVSSAHQYIIFYPESNNITRPTSIQQTINGTSGGVVPYFNVDGAGWGIESAGLNKIYLNTDHAGYNNWLVLGRKGTNATSSNVQIRLINANGGSAPS